MQCFGLKNVLFFFTFIQVTEKSVFWHENDTGETTNAGDVLTQYKTRMSKSSLHSIWFFSTKIRESLAAHRLNDNTDMRL